MCSHERRQNKRDINQKYLFIEIRIAQTHEVVHLIFREREFTHLDPGAIKMTPKALLREQCGRRILQKHVFLNSPEEFAAVAKEACPNIKVLYVSSEDIEKVSDVG